MSNEEDGVWTLDAYAPMKYRSLDKGHIHRDDLPPYCTAKGVNRYNDILPNPRTMVKLEQIGDDIGTTYINANYMKGPNGEPKKYIAAMGPKDNKANTQPAFWRMVWENNVYVIVMTTGTVEKGRAKCAPYWPQEAGASVTHGDITIECKELEERSGFLRSVHTVTKGEGGESRPLEHYWYNTWPDHGVPTGDDDEIYCDNVLNMLTEVNKSQAESAPDQKAPIIVHCSAGVGRTGTFIMCDWLETRLEQTGQFHVIDSIASLREDRVTIVQSESQYEFVHKAAQRFCEMNGKRYEINDGRPPPPPARRVFQRDPDNIYAPSTDSMTVDEDERLIKMTEPASTKVFPFMIADVGKRVTVKASADGVTFKGGAGTLSWVGLHAKKKTWRVGVTLDEPNGKNDGCLRPEGSNGPFDRYFLCGDNQGCITGAQNVTLAVPAAESAGAAAVTVDGVSQEEPSAEQGAAAVTVAGVTEEESSADQSEALHNFPDRSKFTVSTNGITVEGLTANNVESAEHFDWLQLAMVDCGTLEDGSDIIEVQLYTEDGVEPEFRVWATAGKQESDAILKAIVAQHTFSMSATGEAPGAAVFDLRQYNASQA